MQRTLVYAGVSTVVAFLAAACGGAGSPYGSASTPANTPAAPVAAPPSAAPGAYSPPQAAPGTMVGVGSSRLGQILVDGNGRTLYLFEADKGTISSCYNACTQFWPPVLTTGAPQAESGVTGSLLGTTTRRDGTTEVTYAGHPLYYFVTDKQPSDTTGQGLNNFGGGWYVLAPTGSKIDKG